MKQLLILVLLGLSLNAGEVRIKHIDLDDQIALKIAAGKVEQAKKEFYEVEKRVRDKMLDGLGERVTIGTTTFLRITNGYSPEFQWQFVDDYSAFIWVPKERAPKETCIIGINQ